VAINACRAKKSTTKQAWNNGDSVAWTAEFASDADFIHALGGFFHGSRDIERGHRAIFDTIYKGSVAAVFIRANLTWYLNGQDLHIQARPTLVAERNSTRRVEDCRFSRTP